VSEITYWSASLGDLMSSNDDHSASSDIDSLLATVSSTGI